jgi:hypothetical protein
MAVNVVAVLFFLHPSPAVVLGWHFHAVPLKTG